MKKLFFIVVTLLLSACNSGTELGGTYISTTKNSNIVVFKSNNTFEISTNASKDAKVVHYEMKGKLISFVINFPGVFVVNDDGSLTLNNTEKYVKKN